METEEYQIYKPFYEKLVERYPDLVSLNYHFQFALPPIYLRCNGIGGEEFEKLTDFYGDIEEPFYRHGINSLSTYYFKGIDELVLQQQITLEDFPMMKLEDSFCSVDKIITRSLIMLDQNWYKDLEVWKYKTTFDFEETFYSEQWQKDPIEIKLGNRNYPLSERMNQSEYSFTIKIKNMGLYQMKRPWFNEKVLKKIMQYWDEQQMLIADSILVIQDIQMELELQYYGTSSIELCKNSLGDMGELYFLGMPIHVKGYGKVKRMAMEYNSSVQVLGVLSKIIRKEVNQ